MSPSLNRLRNTDDGFTLIELLVSLTVLALASAAMLPVMLVGTRAAAAARLHTQAKSLAQQRLEQMRDLQFHVDRQNGPFVDLLDVYYTDRSATPVSRTRGAETSVGQWVGSGTPAAGEPAVPFYRFKVAQLPGFPAFSQTVATQFLDASGAVIPSSNFSSYDSQVTGSDNPPTLVVGVTLITTWSDHGIGKSYSTYTRIADGRGLVANLSSHAKAEGVRATSSGESGNALLADLGVVEADGSVSTGSSASVKASTLKISDPAGSALDNTPATGVSVSPGSTTTTATGNESKTSGSGCGWVSVGKTAVSGITADVTSGLPKVPSDVDAAAIPTNRAIADIRASGSGCGSSGFTFSNQSSSYSAALGLSTADPLVRIPDGVSSTPLVRASVWLNATDTSATPYGVIAGARVTMAQPLVLFPNTRLPNGTTLPFVASVQVTQATLTCGASTAAGGSRTSSASASYDVTLQWYKDVSGVATLQTQTFSWSSAAAASSADPLPALLSQPVYYAGSTAVPLSTWLSWSSVRSVAEADTSGVTSVDGAVHITTAPVRGTADPGSSIGLDLGRLSCVADDVR